MFFFFFFLKKRNFRISQSTGSDLTFFYFFIKKLFKKLSFSCYVVDAGPPVEVDTKVRTVTDLFLFSTVSICFVFLIILL